MSIIGTFVKADKGFTGTIKTVTLNFKVRLEETEGGSEKAPDYRVYAGTAEIGGGWKETASTGREYIKLKLDDPSFPHPIYASLFSAEDGETFNLVWQRQRAK